LRKANRLGGWQRLLFYAAAALSRMIFGCRAAIRSSASAGPLGDRADGDESLLAVGVGFIDHIQEVCP
jgi:hypothetical protein